MIEYNTAHVKEEDETVEITFEEGITEAMKEKRMSKETQKQMKHRKLTVGYHHGKLNPLSFATKLEVSQNEPCKVDSYVADGFSDRWCCCT